MDAPALLRDLHRELGARFTEVDGREVPRNYGDPAAEYRAARSSAAVVDRSDRAVLRAHGRDPVRMLQGLITNDLAGAPEGQGVYAAVLTPKGKLIADVRLFRRGDELLVDMPATAREALLAHLRKYVPPLYARFEDLSGWWGVLGVYGPRSCELMGRVLGIQLPASGAEDAFVLVPRNAAELVATRTRYAGADGYDVLAPAAELPLIWRGLLEAGARPLGHATLEVLRIEAGRPRWGAELDEGVIPLEADLAQRAISMTKGCYTGQEVIVRILHRGHVNRLLRGLLLGDIPVPTPGTPLLREEKPVGHVTSACHSPRHGQTIGLGYVRREVQPPAQLALGSPAGPAAWAVELPFPERPSEAVSDPLPE